MTIKKTLLASLITLATLSGMAHADSLDGAISELRAITAGMSQAEINQKIERFIERAPEGTSIENALSDFPLAHYVPETPQITPHLDGTHGDATTLRQQAAEQHYANLAKKHDLRVKKEEFQEQAANELVAYQHNNPEGNPTHQTGPATHLDGTHQATTTPHLDAPVIDRTAHLDSNVTDAERNAARYAAYQHNNPEGTPTHQTGPATHLDGTHQDAATPHLDAPVIDRTAHLDSNVTDAERNAARYAAYQHNNPEGNPTHQTDPATHLDGQHNVAQTLTSAGPRQSEQRVLTAEKYAEANTAPHNGIDGKNGADGKDGQSITGKKGANGKDADMTLVNANVVALRGVRNEQAAQGTYIQQNSANVALNRARIASNSAAINQNSRDIAANRKDIDENSKDIKRVGAMAQAVSSLHYNRNESGYAVAAGEYDSEASIAGGMQFRTSQDSAVTVQVSWDGNATGAGVGFHSNF
ncbi:YadA-like family protein [Serratia silvae]|uniref:YadA C-terminal domain-containing protein n=1 Tax=Serratia silvae TaxID=2824122 RepID=A0ABT0KGI5_9GAMM|nr:YadA-like family protein [Serratia silvae]MCL1031148.1 YadA C-terminal domain-containing protein [Serratia silvae]